MTTQVCLGWGGGGTNKKKTKSDAAPQQEVHSKTGLKCVVSGLITGLCPAANWKLWCYIQNMDLQGDNQSISVLMEILISTTGAVALLHNLGTISQRLAGSKNESYSQCECV